MRLGLLYLTFVDGQTGKEECLRCLLAPKPRDHKEERGGSGRPSAPGTRTIRMCSLDDRSGISTGAIPGNVKRASLEGSFRG